MKFFSPFLLVSALALSAPVASQASSVTLDDVVGSWTGVNGGQSVDGIGTDTVNWGTAYNRNGLRSGYGFAAESSAAREVTAGKSFALGTFTHYNRAIRKGGGIGGAELTVDIALNINGESRSITSVFDFAHLETLNRVSSCANGANVTGINANGCADNVTALTNLGKSETFLIDGQEYQFTITSFEGMSEFWTKEEADNSVMLYGMFVLVGDSSNEISPVPLPAAALLLGGGVAGLGLLARRRSR